MTDAKRMLALLEAHPRGVHSHELRRLGISGNPSQRAADLEAQGHEIERKREFRNGRNGTLYKLVRNGSGVERAGAHSRLSGSSLHSGAGVGAGQGSNLEASVDPGQEREVGDSQEPACPGLVALPEPLFPGYAIQEAA